VIAKTVKVITKDLVSNQKLIRLPAKVSDASVEKALQTVVTGLPAMPTSDEDSFDHSDCKDGCEMRIRSTTVKARMDGVEFWRCYPIFKGRLAFVIHRDEAQTKLDIVNRREIHFFSSDFHESYEGYCDDFGPVDLATVYSFCQMVRERLSDACLSQKLLCYYAKKDLALRTNAAFLLGAYLVLGEGFTTEDAMKPLEELGPCAFLPFRDATRVRPSTFHLTLSDCLKGLRRAVSMGWFGLVNFNLYRYSNMDKLFDLHQICPKLVAFRGPDCRDKHQRQPSDFTILFKLLNITDVVRFNEVETYTKNDFEKDGMTVHDLQFFDDCTTPPSIIVDKFIKLVDQAKGTVAVHCLVGLGRTGTLIAVWIMTHFEWTARECIAWLRVVRPGSVLGTQQHYLVACETAIAAKQPLPEPDAMVREQAARMAKQVQAGMLRRRKQVLVDSTDSI